MKAFPNNIFHQNLLILTVVLSCFLLVPQDECFSMQTSQAPTVTVIDDKTGQPIEGAVAIAIWRKHSFTKRAWWEGGTMVVVRIEEAISDRKGNIYIDDFWDWHLFDDRYPHLTIYKPGYVCWDQRNIYINEFSSPERTDFDKEHRIARLKKWPEGFSFNAHSSFVNSCTYGDFTQASQHLFSRAFDFETPLRVNERVKDREHKNINFKGKEKEGGQGQ